jgi:hypothetical protein
MRKTKLYAWITMFFCLVAIGAEAVHAGSIRLLF